MDWATEASVQVVLALFFGLFIGWIIVEMIKASQRRERRADKLRKEKEIEAEEVDFPYSNAFLETVARINKSRAPDSPKLNIPPGKKESNEIDEYHK